MPASTTGSKARSPRSIAQRATPVDASMPYRCVRLPGPTIIVPSVAIPAPAGYSASGANVHRTAPVVRSNAYKSHAGTTIVCPMPTAFPLGNPDAGPGATDCCQRTTPLVASIATTRLLELVVNTARSPSANGRARAPAGSACDQSGETDVVRPRLSLLVTASHPIAKVSAATRAQTALQPRAARNSVLMIRLAYCALWADRAGAFLLGPPGGDLRSDSEESAPLERSRILRYSAAEAALGVRSGNLR